MDITDVTRTAAREVADNIVVENFSGFLENVEKLLLLDLSDLALTLDGGAGMAVIPLREQRMVDDLVQSFTNVLKLRVLLACKNDHGKDCKAVMYSQPCEGEMYVLFMESGQYGIIDVVTVVFFDSLDSMMTQLFKELENADALEKNGADILERESATMLYKLFL